VEVAPNVAVWPLPRNSGLKPPELRRFGILAGWLSDRAETLHAHNWNLMLAEHGLIIYLWHLDSPDLGYKLAGGLLPALRLALWQAPGDQMAQTHDPNARSRPPPFLFAIAPTSQFFLGALEP
jgi:hypothetical protein